VLIGIGAAFLLVAAVTFTALFIALTGSNGRVRVVNGTIERIISGELEICRQHFVLENLEPGHAAMFQYIVRGDSHYTINITFESGATLDAELGYVTDGMDFEDELIVKNSSILIVNLK
jgi:hypothetical protein